MREPLLVWVGYKRDVVEVDAVEDGSVDVVVGSEVSLKSEELLVVGLGVLGWMSVEPSPASRCVQLTSSR
jgi:hypothetical protein